MPNLSGMATSVFRTWNDKTHWCSVSIDLYRRFSNVRVMHFSKSRECRVIRAHSATIRQSYPLVHFHCSTSFLLSSFWSEKYPQKRNCPVYNVEAERRITEKEGSIPVENSLELPLCLWPVGKNSGEPDRITGRASGADLQFPDNKNCWRWFSFLIVMNIFYQNNITIAMEIWYRKRNSFLK
jgi:hypothetical protein